jgi:hypothetical protein
LLRRFADVYSLTSKVSNVEWNVNFVRIKMCWGAERKIEHRCGNLQSWTQMSCTRQHYRSVQRRVQGDVMRNKRMKLRRVRLISSPSDTEIASYIPFPASPSSMPPPVVNLQLVGMNTKKRLSSN